MDSQYFSGNRARLYAALPAGSLLAVFSGEEIRKTSDEFYPFFAERNFVYLTGLECKQAVLLAMKDGAETVRERLYILPPDAHAERWTGKRIRPSEAEATSGVRDVRGGNIPICKSATPTSSSAGCGPSNSPAKSPRCGKRKRSRAKASSP